MVTRIWFSLSVLWFLFVLYGTDFFVPGYPADRRADLITALMPFFAGIFLKFLFRYWITGRLR